MTEEAERVWLVTGGTGQVGRALAQLTTPGVRVISPGRGSVDLADPSLSVEEVFEREHVTAIINCGAFTQVDRAETEKQLAFEVNAIAPGRLARSAARHDIPIVQVSTDYVFAGDKPTPYIEADKPDPHTVYGLSKLAGEREVAASGARHAIVRTAWVFSPGGRNFLRTMLQLGAERQQLSVVDDQYGSPTHATDLAQALATIASGLEAGRVDSGIWHVCNSGDTTWFGFAERIFERAQQHGRHPPALRPVTTTEYRTPARRPANSRLATHKAQRDFGVSLRPWQEACDEAVDAVCSRRIGEMR